MQAKVLRTLDGLIGARVKVELKNSLLGLLEPVTPEATYEMISQGISLWSFLSAEEKEQLTDAARPYHALINQIDVRLLLNWLKQGRPDLLAIIYNSHGGIAWLESMLDEMKLALAPS